MSNKRDTSTKPYEILRIWYGFDKYKRTPLRPYKPEWEHFKYYKSLQAATDAIYDLRRSWYDKAYYDYPGTNLESQYPHIKPSINIYRYKIIERSF